MQPTLKFLLLVVALAYGGTTISASPFEHSSLEARSADYEDFNAREVNDIAILARDPHHSSHHADGSDIAARGVSSYNYHPSPVMSLGARRNFRKTASKKEINAAASNKYHQYHSTAVHMKQEKFIKKNPQVMQKALNNPFHGLNRAARAVKGQNKRQTKAMRVALADKSHPFHKAAKANLKSEQDDQIKNTDPAKVKKILSNPDHHLYKAANRVTKAQEKSEKQPKSKYDGADDLPGYKG